MKFGKTSIAASLMSAALLLGLVLQAHATNYYVSSLSGCSDSFTTSTATQPWCTFTKINTISNGSTKFQPGDFIYLAAGSTWNQELDLQQGSVTPGTWITVTSYGSGANPIINRNDTSTGTMRCVRLTNPDYWNIENLQVEKAGAGILVEFTTSMHNGLNFVGIYATGMEPINHHSDPGPGVTDGILESAGIVLTGPEGNTISLTPEQWTINGVTIRSVEGTGNEATIVLSPPGTNGTTTWGLWNGLLQHIYAHQDIWGQSGSIELSWTSNSTTIEDSIFTDILNSSPTGTTAAISSGNALVIMNDMFTNMPNTGSGDECGWDNEGFNSGNQFLGDYFGGNAGAGIEFLAIHGSGDFDSNNVVTSNLFVNNGLADGNPSSSSQGAIATSGTSDVPTGTASQNLYYDNDGFDDVFAGSGSFSGFTFTNNLAADSASDTWNAMIGFSGMQGENQWYYMYNPGTGTWAEMSTYNAYGTNGVWSSWGADSNTALVWSSIMQPDACSTCWTGRRWIAPKAGNISIRGWVAKHTSGGSGVTVQIGHAGPIIWGPYSLAGTNMAGVATNVDITVAQGDPVTFMVNDGDIESNTDDLITWSPNIVYTSE